jgi:predicted AlkP superfamily phosphohydrolase/phosphomutase
MSVVLPEISSVSWSSFMTGVNPGEHGIFGFVDIKKDSYQYRYPDFRDLRVQPFFDDLGKRRIKSVIINLPFTYPAREIPGILISGFVVPDLKRAVYPEYFLDVLDKFGYEVDVDASKGKDRKLELISDLHYTVQVRKQVADFIWGREKWDLFMFTITGTDRLHHFLFDAYSDRSHQFYLEFRKYYQEIDRIIGDFFERIKENDQYELVLLSDHGFVDLDMEIYINPILKKNGFFHTNSQKVDSLEDISTDSKAFALDPSRIFIHLKDKYPRGKVNPVDYYRIRQDIKHLFEEYRIGSRKVIQKVYFKEEIYKGKMVELAPDIVLLSHRGFDLKAGFSKHAQYERTHFKGMHCFDNAFFYSSKPQLLPERMTICNVKNHIFQLLNVNCEN